MSRTSCISKNDLDHDIGLQTTGGWTGVGSQSRPCSRKACVSITVAPNGLLLNASDRFTAGFPVPDKVTYHSNSNKCEALERDRDITGDQGSFENILPPIEIRLWAFVACVR